MVRRCVATEGELCLHNPLSYDEDGIYLDSLPATGRGGRPPHLAWAVASAVVGGITGIVARRSSSPTAPSGSSVTGVDMTEPLTDQLIKDLAHEKMDVSSHDRDLHRRLGDAGGRASAELGRL